MHSTVAIVGAGLGGLAAAGYLHRAGVDVVVYEQAGELREVGAGIILQPNAVRLIRRLGTGDLLDKWAVGLEVGWIFRRWEDGSRLFSQQMGEECVRRYGENTYTAHRADLLEILRAAVPADALRLGHKLVAVHDPDQPRLEFADGSTATADVVIGADGIHSQVRELVAPNEPPPRFTKLSAFRCLVPIDQAPEFARHPEQSVWLGPGRHLVHYLVSSGQLVNLVGITPSETWTNESWIAEGSMADFVAEFDSWAPELRELISAGTSTARWALFDRYPLRTWTLGRVALLGDAAHPMLPFFAQGAAQAIEDGAALASCLSQGREDLPAALRRYELSRMPRASFLQRISWGRADSNHLPDGPEQRARDAEFAAEDPLGHNAWIYDHDPEHDLADPAHVR